MPNPLSSTEDSGSSDDSKRTGSKQKGKETFSEALAVLQAGLLNLADVAQQLQGKHEREVQNLKNQFVQMRKELKLAGAFTKTLSSSSTTSTVLKTLTEASADDMSRLARLSGGAAPTRDFLARLSAGPESWTPEPAPKSERLEEAKRRRSDRGLGVLQGQSFHGASGKKRAARQSTTESILSTLDSTGTPSGGDSSIAGMSSGSPPSFTQTQAGQAPTPAEWKPSSPAAEPPHGVPPMRLTPPPVTESPQYSLRISTTEEKTEELPSKDLSLADTASLAETELDQEDSSDNDGSQSKILMMAKSTEPVDHDLFKLHDTWTMVSRETTGRRSIVVSSGRDSRRQSTGTMLRRSVALDDLGTIAGSTRCKRLINALTLHPESSIRIAWDLTGMIFLAYDFITVPLQTFGEIFADSETSSSIAIAGTSFWTFDMVVSLRTGFLQKEVVVMSPWLIFLNYAKTWMLLDLCLIGLDWGVISSGSSKSAAGSARMLKFLRVFRLLRLRKVMDFISKVEALSNSNLAVLMLSLFKHVVVLVMLNHLVACLWYFVGESSSGWTDVRTDTHRGVVHEPMSYRYLTSMHWSITQFHGTMEVSPTNELERFMSVIVLVFSMIGNAAFISAVTNKMIQAQNLVSEKTRIEQSFRSYLREHNVSLSLSLRLKKAVSNVQTDKQSREAKEQLLSLIPPNLLLQLHMETRGPPITSHLFLRRMASAHNRPMMAIISHAVQDLQFSSNSDVFQVGEVGKSMYFITSGDLTYKYYPNRGLRAAGSRSARISFGSEGDIDASETFLTKGERISEAPLWVQWVCVGTLKSTSESTILVLDAEGFMKVVQTSKLFHTDAAVYARSFLTILELNMQDGEVITDCVTTPDEWLKRSSSENSSLASES